MTSDAPTGKFPTQAIESNRKKIRAFVARARRIEDHSLFKDSALLSRYAKGEFNFLFLGTNVVGIEPLVPSEESLESLAGRVRPVLLKSDGMYLPTVMSAVAFFADLAGEEELANHVRAIRKIVLDVLESRGLPGFQMDIQPSPGEVVQSLTNVELAESWLYGDVVHADEKRQTASRDFGLEARYFAAVGVYTQMAIYSVEVLRAVRVLEAGGQDVCGTDVFETAVTAPVIDGRVRLFSDDSEGSFWSVPVVSPLPDFPAS